MFVCSGVVSVLGVVGAVGIRVWGVVGVVDALFGFLHLLRLFISVHGFGALRRHCVLYLPLDDGAMDDGVGDP